MVCWPWTIALAHAGVQIQVQQWRIPAHPRKNVIPIPTRSWKIAYLLIKQLPTADVPICIIIVIKHSTFCMRKKWTVNAFCWCRCATKVKCSYIPAEIPWNIFPSLRESHNICFHSRGNPATPASISAGNPLVPRDSHGPHHHVA